MDREEIIRRYILEYDIEVPEERFREEYDYIRAEMLHRMRYDTLAGGDHHFFADDELNAMDEEIRKAALFEAKEGLVLRDIIRKQSFTVTREELEAEAAAMAERQSTSVELIRRFFGEDLAMLEGDIKKQKARDYIVAEASRK